MRKILFVLLSFEIIFTPDFAMARRNQRAGRTRKIRASTTKTQPAKTVQVQEKSEVVEQTSATNIVSKVVENTITTPSTPTKPTENKQLTEAKKKVDEAVSKVQGSCSGIKSNLDTIFGLSVATTVSSGLGTLASGGALASGLVKASKDKKVEETEEKFKENIITNAYSLQQYDNFDFRTGLDYKRCINIVKQQMVKLKNYLKRLYEITNIEFPKLEQKRYDYLFNNKMDGVLVSECANAMTTEGRECWDKSPDKSQEKVLPQCKYTEIEQKCNNYINDIIVQMKALSDEYYNIITFDLGNLHIKHDPFFIDIPVVLFGSCAKNSENDLSTECDKIKKFWKDSSEMKEIDFLRKFTEQSDHNGDENHPYLYIQNEKFSNCFWHDEYPLYCNEKQCVFSDIKHANDFTHFSLTLSNKNIAVINYMDSHLYFLTNEYDSNLDILEVLDKEIAYVNSDPKYAENSKNSELIENMKNLEKEKAQSKLSGNLRTGLMAGATATSAVSTGTSIGATLTATKLAEKMAQCNTDLQALKIAKSELEALESKNEKADAILSACTGYDEANIKSLKSLATANAVVSGIGTVTAGTGTVTSVIASKREGKTYAKNKRAYETEKTKALNTTSNILAGVTIGTSGASTALSAVQISKAKKDSEIAEKCESAL